MHSNLECAFTSNVTVFVNTWAIAKNSLWDLKQHPPIAAFVAPLLHTEIKRFRVFSHLAEFSLWSQEHKYGG